MGRPRKAGARTPSGQLSRAEREEIVAPALAVRSRLAAVELTDVSKLVLKQPWYGCRAGRSIAEEPDVVDLWGVVKQIRQARANFLRSVGLPDEAAKCMRLAVKSGSDDDPPPPPDLRTPEERALHARRAWEAVVCALGDDLDYVMTLVIQDCHQQSRLARVLKRLSKALV